MSVNVRGTTSPNDDPRARRTFRACAPRFDWCMVSTYDDVINVASVANRTGFLAARGKRDTMCGVENGPSLGGVW